MSGCHGINLDQGAEWAKVSGMLNLSHDEIKTHKMAHCKIHVFPDWKSQQPIVWCLEPWIRHDWNWHAGAGGLLCYVLGEQWTDFVGGVLKCEGAEAATRYATDLCLRNVRWLLYRHYIGHVTKMKIWPKDWPAWPHGDAGRREYLRSTKNGDNQ